MSLRKAIAYGTAVAATAALSGAVLVGNRIEYQLGTRPLQAQVYEMKQEAEKLKAANAEMKRELGRYTRLVVRNERGEIERDDGTLEIYDVPVIVKELTMNPDGSVRTDSISGSTTSGFREDFGMPEFRELPMQKQQERMR